MNEELKLIISAEITKLKQGIDNAKSQINNFKEQVKNASAQVENNFKKIGTGLTDAAKTMGVGFAAVSGALLALGGSTEEYRNQQAQLITAFEEAGASADTAKATYNDLYRVLGDSGQAQEAAQHLAKLTTEEKALTEWTTITQGVYATFGASLPIESLTEAANETAKTGELTGSLADALNWAGVSEEAFTEKLDACNTEAEREALIRETLSGLYSDAAATYEENNKQVLAQRDAQAALQEKLAALGETLAPVITAFTNFATNALAIVVPHIQSLAEQYLPLLEDVLAVVAETLGKVMGYIADNWQTILTIAGVIGGIAAAIGLYNTVAAIKAAMDAAQVTTLAGLAAAYAAQAAAMAIAIAPYALIVAAIAAVIAIIVVCIKHWDEIKAKVKEVWGNIKEWTVKAAENVKESIGGMVDSVKGKFNDMKNDVSKKTEEIRKVATEKFNQAKDSIEKSTKAAKDTAVNSLNSMATAYKQNGGGIRGTVAATMEGIKGLYNTGYTFINTLTNGKFGEIYNTISGKMKSALTIISNILQSIKNKFSSVMESAKSIVSAAIDKIKGVFNFSWSLPKLKLPHFSVSGGEPPWGFMGEGSLPRISVDWYAKGGVFDSPTFFTYGGNIGGLGENGAEAIVPLERNTEWMNKLATMLSERMGINQPIVLQVDGKTFAQVSVDSINQLTKQRGSIPLKII